ncbi:hypothetical protein [Thioclava sp.]|uniref:hypothetical protein n=1 Tax=Thioclava sp. TaxID=1933450 RepID=UPI003241C7EB
MPTQTPTGSFPTRPIVVVCRPFDENSGGQIVLHALIDRMRSLGVDAYASQPCKTYRSLRPAWLGALKRWNYRRKLPDVAAHESMDVPTASDAVLDDAIVVYPETVRGNPLEAERVARWLLNRPGLLGGNETLDPGEEVFFYQEAFAEGVAPVSPDRLLRVRWLRDDVYRDENRPRSGSCRMIRKGTDTLSQIPEGDRAIPLDGLSHQEIAEVFNKTEVFYCHDLYTMYAYYAALSGCVPVVVPRPGLSAEDWRDGFELKHGVAYGEEEIDWARATRNQLIADMAAAKEQETENVLRFLAILKERFG